MLHPRTRKKAGPLSSGKIAASQVDDSMRKLIHRDKSKGAAASFLLDHICGIIVAVARDDWIKKTLLTQCSLGEEC